MFGNLLRPLGREFRITPFLFEKQEGCQEWPLKSPLLATRTPRSKRSGSVRADGYAIHRDDPREVIQMFTPENKPPQAGDAGGADEATVETNHKGDDSKKPASKALFAEADQVIATFPCILTRERKSEAKRLVLALFLAALAASRQERAV